MFNTPVSTNGMVFDDEFNTFTSSADGWSGTWMTNYTFGGEGAVTLYPNKEAEFYSSDTSGKNSPFTLANGVLDITAFKAAGNRYNLPYTSGLITTARSFAMTYGYFEARMQLPAGQGLWPAFWMLPVTATDATELDALEMLGNDPSTFYSTTHGSSGVSQAFHVPDTSAGFHTYGVDWEPTTVTFYMDGVKLGSTPTPSSMNSPMYMLLNLAVGGNGSWPGAPNSSSTFPATMQIDYVRAYATAGTTYVGGSASYAAAPVVNVLGSGPDTLSLVVSEDAYLGDAQFTISVDGKQVGGTQTATASHAAGAASTFQVDGTFGTGVHSVTVNFLNDAWGGSAATDRNLYVSSVSLNGDQVANSALAEYTNGPQSVSFYGSTAGTAYQPTTIIGSGQDVLALQVAEDAYLGDAQFTISVDGTQIGGTQTATALHGSGATQAFDVMGNFGNGPHTVAVNFLNDAYGGSPTADRNLYVQSATIDNAAIPSSQLTEYSSGPQSIAFQAASPPDTLTIGVSEDAYKGDAQYVVLVDGYIQNWWPYTATASHAAGQVSLQTLNLSLSKGPHQIGISFINDLTDSGGDRNLYINSVAYDGNPVAMTTTEQASNGTSYVSVMGSPATSDLTLHLSEDAYQGDAQFLVTVDGKQLGGVQSVSALEQAGATQAFDFSARLTAGMHDIGVSFINDLYGGNPAADRNLYVRGAELNGTSLSQTTWNASMMSNGTNHFSLMVPS